MINYISINLKYQKLILSQIRGKRHLANPVLVVKN